MKLTIYLFVLTLLLSACQNTKEPKWTYEAFFEQAFEIIKQESIKKNDINWAALKQDVKDSITRFASNQDAYDAIKYTVELIDDGHSVFVDATTPNRLSTDTISIPQIETDIVGDSIGYLKLPGLVANDSITHQYSSVIRKALLDLDKSAALSGWIIDLRENSGGKLGSECLGLAPLFSDTLVGLSRNNQNELRTIVCKNDRFYFGDVLIDTLICDRSLSNHDKKVAVLTSNNTVSAGEFLALAFMFQDSTRVFGTRTRGKTSHLQLMTFKSNALLLLAVEEYCDINKNSVPDGVYPEVECLSEDCMNEVIDWIEGAT